MNTYYAAILRMILTSSIPKTVQDISFIEPDYFIRVIKARAGPIPGKLCLGDSNYLLFNKAFTFKCRTTFSIFFLFFRGICSRNRNSIPLLLNRVFSLFRKKTPKEPIPRFTIPGIRPASTNKSLATPTSFKSVSRTPKTSPKMHFVIDPLYIYTYMHLGGYQGGV
jgi:hypothetical protein